MHRTNASGFTLIELSIVLVIIGLIVGGILVGQNLISAAGARAEISQIEKYQTAMHTFQTKYGYLPGEVPPVPAAQFGFISRAGTEGRGDGNGLVEGWGYVGGCLSTACGYAQSGETAFFWEDLSAANLIDGTFNSATDAVISSNITLTSSPSISMWIPKAKLGNGNFVFVTLFSSQQGGQIWAPTDYFSVAAMTLISSGGNYTAKPAMTVLQAYSIDKKIDDGFPITGQVEARYTPAGMSGDATSSSSTSCYDNNNVQGGTQTYSLEVNGGAGINCGLSFQFQ